MSVRLRLPGQDGTLSELTLREPTEWHRPSGPIRSRIAFAAAHVVADPMAPNGPGAPAAIDWDETLAVRRTLWGWGLQLAEAMDTSQRGMGLDWAAATELVRRSAAEARAAGGRIASGVNTDHVEDLADLDQVVRAYEEQLAIVEGAGSQAIVMASRDLVRVARSADDYLATYRRVLAQASEPVILHWLGPMFDPRLEGYWGTADVRTATDTFLAVVEENRAKVDGVKISLLDADLERDVRSRLPQGVRLYTGDDFNYPELILGDGTHHSDALLGIFSAIAPAASTALQALDAGDAARFDEVLAPTVPLSRHLFSTPTYNYKTGIAFLSWLNGQQRAFSMVGGMQSARGIVHLADTVRLADAAGLIVDPEQAASRMRALLVTWGVG